jgi:hypothetical protein
MPMLPVHIYTLHVQCFISTLHEYIREHEQESIYENKHKHERKMNAKMKMKMDTDTDMDLVIDIDTVTDIDVDADTDTNMNMDTDIGHGRRILLMYVLSRHSNCKPFLHANYFFLYSNVLKVVILVF